MTNRSLPLNKPFLMSPFAVEKLWGGTRLRDDFSKNSDLSNLAETWECSTHPSGVSVVVSGEHKGKSLTQVINEHPEYAGTHPDMRNGLPVLIKFIDAKMDLSVQVHPDDVYAAAHENGQWGKSEMWYVLDATKDAKLVYGLNQTINEDTLLNSLREGTLEKYLQKVPVQKDDVFFVEAGTIHAIGAGALIAEIQENSDLTYRLYDYNREDKDGQKRELHVEPALRVANLQASDSPRQPMRMLRYRKGWASELLCNCKYFQVERVLLNTERIREMVAFATDGLSFSVLLCVDGCGIICLDEQEYISFFKGDCIFVPANSIEMKIHGSAQLLRVRC